MNNCSAKQYGRRQQHAWNNGGGGDKKCQIHFLWNSSLPIMQLGQANAVYGSLGCFIKRQSEVIVFFHSTWVIFRFFLSLCCSKLFYYPKILFCEFSVATIKRDVIRVKFFSYFSFFLFRQPFIKSYLYAAGTSTGKITVARPQKGLQSGLGKKKNCFLKQFFVEKVDLFSKTHVFKCIQNDLCLWCLASCFS